MKIIAIMNQKGGVGKTTVTVNMAAGLARAHKKVLIIDADLQSNATTALGLSVNNINQVSCDLFSVLTGACSFEQSLLQRTMSSVAQKYTLHVVPATIALSGFDQVVRALPHKQMLLKQLLSHVAHQYDYILIDCPPSLGLVTINALVAADEVIVPVQPEFFALQGLSQILDTIDLLCQNMNPKLHLGGVLCTRFNRRKIHNEVLACLHDRFGKKLFATKIHENIAIAEAPSFGKTIFEYSPKSLGSYDFALFINEFLHKDLQKVTMPLRMHRYQAER